MEEANERAIDDFMRSPRANGKKSVLPTNSTNGNGSFVTNRNSTSAVVTKERSNMSADRNA